MASTSSAIRALAAVITSSLVLAVFSVYPIPFSSRYAFASAMGVLELSSDKE